MNFAFNAAYEAAEAFSRLYAQRYPGAGFLRTILLRRIGSSARAGLETARHLLGRIDTQLLPEEEVGDEGLPAENAPPDLQEIQFLREVERNLAAVVGGEGTDPKVQVILHYLHEQNWLERNGAIIFSQYRTTAEWVLEALCATYPRRAGRTLRRWCGLVRPARGGPPHGRARANQEAYPGRRGSACLRNQCRLRGTQPPAARGANERGPPVESLPA